MNLGTLARETDVLSTGPPRRLLTVCGVVLGVALPAYRKEGSVVIVAAVVAAVVVALQSIASTIQNKIVNERGFVCFLAR